MKLSLIIPKHEPIINFEIKVELDSNSSFHFLLGQNGTGKTILAKSIIGLNDTDQYSSLYKNDQDKILICLPSHRRYLPQNPEDGLFPQFNLSDNVSLLNKLFALEMPATEKEIMTLLEIADMKFSVSQLSVGQKKKLLLNFILKSLPPKENIQNPIIVVLDEPFAGIDKSYSVVVQDLLNNEAKKYIGSLVIFLVIEHETILNFPSGSKESRTTIRKGVDMRIVSIDKIELK